MPKRIWTKARSDGVTDWAAALTYYGVLSVFPGLIALVALLGLIGGSATGPLLDNLEEIAPGPVHDLLASSLESLQNNQGQAGVLVVVGLAAALWSASAYVGAYSRASNSIYEVEEDRPYWKRRPIHLLTTIALLVLLAAMTVAVAAAGPLAGRIGEIFGFGDEATQVWAIVKWPMLMAMVAAVFAILYWVTPNVRTPGLGRMIPGACLAVSIWIVASIGFTIYVSSFGSYNATYGALGGVIIFLIWLWLSNLALLLGSELNAVLDSERKRS